MPDQISRPWPQKNPVVVALAALFLLSLIAYFGLKARNEARQYDFIGVPIERNTIVVSGDGKVTAIPDVATIDLGTTTEKTTVAEAQKENTRIMNEVNARLDGFGVAKKDVQTTSYNISPTYDYLNGQSKIRGYVVSQNLHVKIRDLGKIGDIIGAAGSLGANQIGGINFDVDEPESIKQQARVLALQNAKEKADALAKVVGVKLRRVVSFEESVNGPTPQPYYYSKMGLGAADAAAPAPQVEAGSTEFTVTATVTYEIE